MTGLQNECMEYRQFGNTSLKVSVVGFGAWAIGGPAMAGDIPIGWGDVSDEQSIRALKHAFEQGINFYDKADFYGFGHSEELIGKTFGNRDDVVIATKVGQRLGEDEQIFLDYSYDYLIEACEQSLRRLRRDTIDFYQLHVARMPHLEDGQCIEAMEKLREQGKIRYWGLSLNTFAPEPEAEFLMERQLGHGFQLVLNMLNQRAVPIMEKATELGYGIIARMPLQFGLLTGKFTPETTFPESDHRSLRLARPVLETSLNALEPAWEIADKYGLSKTELALSFIISFKEVSTVIPGIKTAEQAEKNTSGLVQLEEEGHQRLRGLYEERFLEVMDMMQGRG